MAKKQITNEELALAIKKGFDGVDKKFDGVGKEFDGVNKKFEKAARERKDIKRDLDEIKMKFAYTAWQIDVNDLRKRLMAVEKKLGIKSPLV